MTAHNPNLRPENFNRLGRPPRTLPTSHPVVREFLASPGILNRLRTLARTEPQGFNELLTDLNQHERAMSNSRALPGEWMGSHDGLPYVPLPFAPREQYRPDRAPGTPDHDLYRTAIENVEAGCITAGLQRQMREHDPDSGDSTWNRTAPSAERTSSTAEREPSLRESVGAAFDAHVSNSGD